MDASEFDPDAALAEIRTRDVPVEDEAHSYEQPSSTEASGPTDRQITEVPSKEPGARTFRIGEVARMVGVKAYVIRYWETEFPSIRPEKTETGQRRYTQAEVELIGRIKELRHDAQLSVAQARAVIEEGATPVTVATSNQAVADLSGVGRRLTVLRREVLDLLAWLED